MSSLEQFGDSIEEKERSDRRHGKMLVGVSGAKNIHFLIVQNQ